MPSLSIVPVELFSITTSDCFTSSNSNSRPSGVFALAPSARFERLDEQNDGFISPPSTMRMKSG